MIVCQENLHHVQELQKRAHNKGVKPWSYVSDEKVWLNSKYIKIKRNQKLEAKFFRPFWVLYPVGKQAYKLDFSKKWKIYLVFYLSLLEQNITRKEWDDNTAELNAGDNSREYEVEAIWDSALYARELKSGYLLSLYYLVSWKGYPEKENTWEPASTVQQLRKLISLFHKDHPNKLTATFPAIDTASLIARPTTRPTKFLKQKRGQPTGRAKKRIKWIDKEEATKRNPSKYSSRARSRQVVGDLSPWRKERWGTYSDSLIIGNLTLKELHSTLFWPSPLLSKSFLKQTPFLSINLFLFCPSSRLESFFIDDIYTL